MRRGSRTPPAASVLVGAGEGPGGRRRFFLNTCEGPAPHHPGPHLTPSSPSPTSPGSSRTRFGRRLPWVTSAPQIFPSEIATLIENRGSALSPRGLLRRAHGPRQQGATGAHSLGSCNSTGRARGPQSLLAAQVASQHPSRVTCSGLRLLAHSMAQPKGEDHHRAKPEEQGQKKGRATEGPRPSAHGGPSLHKMHKAVGSNA